MSRIEKLQDNFESQNPNNLAPDKIRLELPVGLPLPFPTSETGPLVPSPNSDKIEIPPLTVLASEITPLRAVLYPRIRYGRPAVPVVESDKDADKYSSLNPAGLFLKELAKTPFLGPEEEIQVAMEIEEGRKARSELYSCFPNEDREEQQRLKDLIEKGIQAEQRMAESNLRLVKPYPFVKTVKRTTFVFFSYQFLLPKYTDAGVL